MNLLYLIYTHNRPAVLYRCLESLLESEVKPSQVLILDDNSDEQTRQVLFNFIKVNSEIFPIHLLLFKPNMGYGASADIGMKMVDFYNPDYVFFIESDYIFKKNGLDQVIDIFENTEFGQKAVAFSGYDNPDFYSREHTERIYPELIRREFGEDNLNRDILYKPFPMKSRFGNIDVEFVSNSCGTMYFNWKILKKIREVFPIEYEDWLRKVTNRDTIHRMLLNDGSMSHGIAYLWTKWALINNIDINSYSAILNIKPSIANHINGGGINGKTVLEGQSFTDSPTWGL